MAAVGHEQTAFSVDGHGLLDRLSLLDERERIQNHSAANNAGHFPLKNSGWDPVQNVTAISKADGVTGVVSALVSRDAVEFLRQDIDDLTFSFVAPLHADDCEIHFR